MTNPTQKARNWSQELISFLPISFRDRYRSNWNSLQLEVRVSSAKIARQFIRPKFPNTKEVNLHLGCGMINHPKFINIDGIPAPHIHYIRAINNLSIFKDETADLIYASHCLEHFRYNQTEYVLNEWLRVLKVNGVLRLSVPNFDYLLRVYHENDRDLDLIIGELLAGQASKYDYHLSLFNEKKLKSLLKKAGFRDINYWDINQDEYSNLNDLSNYHIEVNNKKYPVSLNLEAIK